MPHENLNYKNYSLALIGGKSNTLANAESSREMLIAGLKYEFKQLKHIKLYHLPITYQQTIHNNLFINNVPKVDFLLIRLYTSSSIIKNIEKIRNKIKYQICSFIEHPQEMMDFSFGYLRNNNPDCYIAFPYSKEFMINKSKTPKTILLDNNIGTRCDISKKISRWLQPLIKENYKIYQLTKKETHKSFIKPADFIEPITMCNYKKYMNLTSQIETFIQTHPGSYEHSIIDMVGRGIKTLIPINQPEFRGIGTFIPSEIVKDLELPTFNTQKELLKLIKTPTNINLWNSKIKKMTEMKQVIQIIDNHFQNILNKNTI